MNYPKMSPPRNCTEAVTLGLFLAITASTDEKAAMASDLAEARAGDLTHEQVEACKAEARRMVEEAEWGGANELLH